MGIHLDYDLLEIVKKVLCNAPMTMVLASATLTSWESLPAFWKGRGKPATRCSITQGAHSQPTCRLVLFDEVALEHRDVNMLEIFHTYEEFRRAVAASAYARVLLLRHLTAEQANELAEVDSSSWLALSGDVRTLREGLEPKLMELSEERFWELRTRWRSNTKKVSRMLDLSQSGITMIATLNPRQLAIKLAGKVGAPDSESMRVWHDSVHELGRRHRELKLQDKVNEKQADADKKAKSKDEDEMTQEIVVAPRKATIELRPGLSVDDADIESVDNDILMMLSKGISFACSEGCEPLVGRLYQQALLHIPEKAIDRKQPPIHTLVVDYSSIYGTDCPAVDTIILCDDLGRLLTWDDHQQFLGRLRRDGQAVLASMQTIRNATLRGIAVSSFEANFSAQVQEVMAAQTGAKIDADKVSEELRKVMTVNERTTDEVCAALFTNIALNALESSAATADDPKKTIPFWFNKMLKPWCGVIKVFGKRRAAQIKLINTLEKMATGKDMFEGKGTEAYLKHTEDLLWLMNQVYEPELISEAAALEWKDQAREAGREGMPFWRMAEKFFERLAESEEEDDEEDED
jgi:flagellar hook-basal body complex protein FliE